MVELEIPKTLGKWIVAYRTISELEYEFYFRELGINAINIKIEEFKETKKYCGEIRFKIDKTITASFTIPASMSSNFKRTVVKSLKEFISYRIKQGSGIFKLN